MFFTAFILKILHSKGGGVSYNYFYLCLYFFHFTFLCIKLFSLEDFGHFIPFVSFFCSFLNKSAARVSVWFDIYNKNKGRFSEPLRFQPLAQQHSRCTYRALSSDGSGSSTNSLRCGSPAAWYLLSLKSLRTNMQSITKQCAVLGRVSDGARLQHPSADENSH